MKTVYKSGRKTTHLSLWALMSSSRSSCSFFIASALWISWGSSAVASRARKELDHSIWSKCHYNPIIPHILNAKPEDTQVVFIHICTTPWLIFFIVLMKFMLKNSTPIKYTALWDVDAILHWNSLQLLAIKLQLNMQLKFINCTFCHTVLI